MKSTIYLDADFNFLLLENEESENTEIYINLTTSEATNQRFEISVAGGAAESVSIPSGREVNFKLLQKYWADDETTTITPKNTDTTGAALEIIFPAAFDTGASLNLISETEFEVSAQSKAFAESAGASGSGSGYGSPIDFVETIRNIGFRLLDEPNNVSIEYS